MLGGAYFEPLAGGSYLGAGSGGGASFSGDVEIKIALGSFTIEPFLWPHLADKITATWGTNVDSCRVFLEGADGSRVLLNDNQSGTPKYRPAGQSTEYAGSWAQDYGAGAVTDTGTDYGPTTGGVSSSVMGDPHRATAFQMLADRTATYLVFVVTPTDPSAAVEIQCPLLEYTKASQRKHVWENAHQVAVIHPNGAGVRAGIFNTGTSGTLNNPPSLYDPSERPNTIDWLVTERLLLEGIAHDSGLTTELTSLRDTNEGQSVGNERNNSHAFLLPPSNGDYQLALVSSLAETPPIGHFPKRGRGTTWEADGDPVQHVWVAMQEPAYFVNPEPVPELRADDDTTVWTATATGVTGWAVSAHSHAVVNTEDDFGVWAHGDRYAVVRPFRGHYMVLLPGTGSGITYCSAPDRNHYLAFVDGSGYIVTWASDNALNWVTQTQSFSGTRPNIGAAKDGSGRVRLCYEDGGTVYRRESYDGINWGTASAGHTGEFMVTVNLEDRGFFEYWLDGTDIKGQEYDNNEATIGSSFTAVSGVDADSAFDADEYSPGASAWGIRLWCLVSGVPTLKTSTDGKVFS